MKFLKVLALTGLLLGAKQASADIEVTPFGGYTLVNMNGGNRLINSIRDDLSFLSIDSATDFNSGYYFGLDASIPMPPYLRFGPRFEFVGASAELDLGDTLGEWTHLHYDPTLMMYELGVSSDFSPSWHGFSVQAGLWGGLGILGGQEREEDNEFGDRSTDLGGMTFVWEAMAQARYQFSSLISANLDLGYRGANIPAASSSGPSFTGPSGTLRDDHGNETGFDFSGLNLGGSVSFNF